MEHSTKVACSPENIVNTCSALYLYTIKILNDKHPNIQNRTKQK